MVMAKSVHVTLKEAHEWGPRESGTLDIFEQTSNSLSPLSTINSQFSWSYGLTYVLTCVVHRLPYELISSRSAEAWSRHNSNIPSTDRLYKVSPQITNRLLTVSMPSYPWSWRPQDVHQVSETGICHGTKANHHPTLPHQSNNNRQELISTQSVKDEQRYQ